MNVLLQAREKILKTKLRTYTAQCTRDLRRTRNDTHAYNSRLTRGGVRDRLGFFE